MDSFIYFREHPYYQNCFKVGSTNNLKTQNDMFQSMEIEKGFFKYAYQFPFDIADSIEKIIFKKFKKFHIYKGGGKGFYKKEIISHFDNFLQEINETHKKLNKKQIHLIIYKKNEL
jgi:hypothetical protein